MDLRIEKGLLLSGKVKDLCFSGPDGISRMAASCMFSGMLLCGVPGVGLGMEPIGWAFESGAFGEEVSGGASDMGFRMTVKPFNAARGHCN